MIQVYRTVDGRLQQIDDPTTKGAWLHVVNPTPEELARVQQATGLPLPMLQAPLDEEERPRLEFEPGQALVILDVPFARAAEIGHYETLPLGVLITQDHLVTVSLEPSPVIEELLARGNVHTAKRTRLLLQVLVRTATLYLRYLKQIDRRIDQMEQVLYRSIRNRELVAFLTIEKSLIYFTTSIRSNQIVMERLLRSHLRREGPGAEGIEGSPVRFYPEDEDLLEDVITENRQALETADIYSHILGGLTDAFASIISNNLNNVVRVLTVVTIVLAVPTTLASFYGMNVPLPFQQSPWAFPAVLVLSLVLGGLLMAVLTRRSL